MNAFSKIKGSTSDIRVLQISDMHLFASENEQLVGINTQKSFSAILELAKQHSWPPDFIFLTGDLSQDASCIAYKRLADQLKSLNIPCYVLPGNHDKPDLLRKYFVNGPCRYQNFLHTDKWLFAFLNTATPNEEGGTFNKDEIIVLEQELKKYPEKNTLICFHHQLISVNSTWLDTMAICNADLMINLITQHHNIKGLIHGHVHQEFMDEVNGIPVYGTPSTCFQFKPGSVDFQIDQRAPGYRWLEFGHNGDINTSIVRLENTPHSLDSLSTGY